MDAFKKYLNLIDDLISDKSFPSIIKIDGDWGCGKSYFIKNELIPHLRSKKNNVKYFSLAGISCLNDFQNKIIASRYISEKESPDALKDIANVGTSILGMLSNKDQYLGLMGGLSGAVKEAALNRIDNCIFIMDDLERIKDENSSAQILGECLQITDEKNVTFIFIANTKKITIDIDLHEKVFSDSIQFALPYHSIIDIVFGNEKWLENHKTHIEKIITRLNFCNIRILKRAKNKLANLRKQLDKIESLIHTDHAEKTLIESVLQVIHAFYISKLSANEMNEAFGLKILPQKNDTEDKYSVYDLTFTPPSEFINFCCSKSTEDPKVSDSIRILYKKDPIDEITFSPFHNLDNNQCQNMIKTLKEYLFEGEKPEIKRYFEAADHFLYLIDSQYIDESKVDYIEKLKEKLSIIKFKENETEQWHSRRIEHIEIQELFSIEHKKLTQKLEDKKNRELKKKIADSWCHIDMEIYRNHQFSCLINKFKVDEWLGFIDSWSPMDMYTFADFIRSRYRIANAKEYLYDEKLTLESLKERLELRFKQLKPGPEKGRLNNLLNTVSFACEKLK